MFKAPQNGEECGTDESIYPPCTCTVWRDEHIFSHPAQEQVVQDMASGSHAPVNEEVVVPVEVEAAAAVGAPAEDVGASMDSEDGICMVAFYLQSLPLSQVTEILSGAPAHVQVGVLQARNALLMWGEGDEMRWTCEVGCLNFGFPLPYRRFK